MFTGRELILIAQYYLGVALVLAVNFGASIGLDSRRRNTVIDWGRHTVSLQVGWTTREVTFEEIEKLTSQISEPKLPDTRETTESRPRSKSSKSKKAKRTNKTDSASGFRTSYPARIVLRVPGKSYVLLEIAYHAEAIPETRERLHKIAKNLAPSLNVSVA